MAIHYIDDTVCQLRPGNTLESRQSTTKAYALAAVMRAALIEEGGEYALTSLDRYLKSGGVEGVGGINQAREVARKTGVLTMRAAARGDMSRTPYILDVFNAYVPLVSSMLENVQPEN